MKPFQSLAKATTADGVFLADLEGDLFLIREKQGGFCTVPVPLGYSQRTQGLICHDNGSVELGGHWLENMYASRGKADLEIARRLQEAALKAITGGTA